MAQQPVRRPGLGHRLVPASEREPSRSYEMAGAAGRRRSRIRPSFTRNFTTGKRSKRSSSRAGCWSASTTRAGGRVAFSFVRFADYAETGAIPLDTEDLINFPRSIAGVEVALMFMEQRDGTIKVSFRSRRADVGRLAEQFGGGGHRLAAGATLPGPMDAARERVLAAVVARSNHRRSRFDSAARTVAESAIGSESPASRRRITLRALPLAVRLTLAVFLITVGFGYGAALVQVHFQDSRGGKLLPDGDDLVRKFHGEPDPANGSVPLERLLRTPEHDDVPFNGQGSMFRAFTDKSNEWRKTLKGRPEAEVRQRTRRRTGRRPRLAAHRPEPGRLRRRQAAPAAGRTSRSRTSSSTRTAPSRSSRCSPSAASAATNPTATTTKAAKFPLATYEQIKAYSKVDTGAMSLPALAQSTHTHLSGVRGACSA